MIDKKGKLFGVINFIDFLCILLVVAIALFLTTRNKKATIVDAEKVVTVKFFGEDVANYISEVVKVGDRLEDESKNLFLGTIKQVNISDSVVYSIDQNGNSVKSKKEGYNAIEVIAELKAQTFENGIIIEGNKYGVGHSLTVRAGKGVVWGRISGLD